MMADPDGAAGQRTPIPAAADADLAVVRLIEEKARIGKRQVEGDRVRVTTHTEIVEEHIRQSLRTDVVDVKRVAVNRTLAAGEPAPTMRVEGGVTIVPVLEEIVFVEKRLVLREELHIVNQSITEEVEIPVTLRKQRAVIDRSRSDTARIVDGGSDGTT